LDLPHGALSMSSPPPPPSRTLDQPATPAPPPRVRLEYQIDCGDPAEVEIPFVVGVLADLSGQHEPAKTIPREPAWGRGAVAERRFVEIDKDNFEERMRAIGPRAVFEVPDLLRGLGTLRVELLFRSMEDFLPHRVALAVEPVRARLVEGEWASEPWVFGTQPETGRAPRPAPRAAMDPVLCRQLNLVLHHSDFLRLEAAWRGLHYLVFGTDTGPDLRIRVLNISKAELLDLCRRYEGHGWDRSPLFQKIHDEEMGTFGGMPYGILVGDFFFDHHPTDLTILKGIARMAAAAHAPFIAGAAPGLFKLSSWRELNDAHDFHSLWEGPDYASWRSLRDSEEARFLCLTLPRWLARLPHRGKAGPAQGFDFEEDWELSPAENLPWANAAYALGLRIARAFRSHGWCANIRGVESGGVVDDLAQFSWPGAGGERPIGPAEVALTDRRAMELAKSGLVGLFNFHRRPGAAFLSADSLHKPKQFDKPQATMSAACGAKLPYLLAGCRFMQYLRCMVRDKLRGWRDAADLVRYLNLWLAAYARSEADAKVEIQARYPLAAAEVKVTSLPGSSNLSRLQLRTRPRFQLEPTADLHLSAVIPIPSNSA
jgi:type VI secretion system protein ImpC